MLKKMAIIIRTVASGREADRVIGMPGLKALRLLPRIPALFPEYALFAGRELRNGRAAGSTV